MIDKLRILMTADTIGGVWNFTLQLCEALGDRATILVATMGDETKPHQRDALHALGVRLEESMYRLEWMDDPWKDLVRAGEWLLDLQAVFQPDIIHLNTYVHGTLPWSSPVLMVGHSCVCSWWEAVYGTAPPPEWSQYRQRVGLGLRSADLVAAPTRAMLQCLTDCYGELPNARTIHNGLAMPAKSAVTKEPLVLTAGRAWDQAKNVLALFDVAREVPWPTYVAGSTTDPTGYTYDLATLRQLGVLEPRELHRWMEGAAIYAAPARYEPFGLAILEAAQRRCALVLGDIPSLRELWHDAALFVAPDDREALRDALLTLIKDEALRRDLAERAFMRAHDYTPERMADAYLRAYAELAGAPVTG